MFSSQLNQLIVVVSFTSTLFTAEFNTSSTESISSISIFSVLKRHFEVRYCFDFFHLLNLLIMKCIKNVIDFQQILKSRSYKKTINNSSRDEWLKIMKNENKFLLINEIWTLINFFKDWWIFRDKWVYKIKKINMTKFCVTKRDEWFVISSKSKDWIIRRLSSRWSNQWIIKQCTS
jgi:hypothetical protein